MIVDAEEDFFRALKRAGLTQEQLDARIEAAVERVLARREEKLETYAQIVGCKPDTGRKAIKRAQKTDPALVALGTYVGRIWKARRSLVLNHLATKKGRAA